MYIIPHRLAFIFTLLLSVLLFTGCGGGGGGGGGTPGTSDDTDGDGFANSVDVDDDNNGLIEISSLEQLDWIRNDLAGASLTDNVGNVDTSGCPVDGCHGYELVADLDFDTNGDGVMDANDTYYDNGKGWLPIGRGLKFGETGTPFFNADFNGNGHSIRNLYINRPQSDTKTGGTVIGLFGFVDSAGKTITLNNIILDGSLMNVTGARFTGSLAGAVANAMLNNITITGNISGTTDTGGLLGTALTNVSLKNCTTSGTVNGGNRTGGLFGSIAPTLATPEYVNPSITDSQVNSVITGKTYTGVFVGSEYQDATITNSSATGQDESDYDGDGVRNGDDVDVDNNGLIEISSLQQLDWMRNNLAGTSLTNSVENDDNTGCPTPGCHGYELVADLDFDTNGDGVMDGNDTYDNNGSGWMPIGDSVSPFTADFNGNGHTIRNLFINRSTTANIGLFGYVNGSNSVNVIQNINLENVQVAGYKSTGTLVGFVVTSKIINCSASGAVTGNNYNTGGLVGYLYNKSTINNSTASVTVTGINDNTGGLAGYVDNNSTISNSSASGAVTGNNDNTGGLVGDLYFKSTISNSSASGAVTGNNDSTGGLVGNVYNSTISNSSTSSVVTGNNDSTGGLAGYVNNFSTINDSAASGTVHGSGIHTGALVGYVAGSAISNNSASGAVEGNRYTGGLVGYVVESTISNSSASGAVTGSGDQTGGLVGYLYSNSTISNSSASGAVTSNKDITGGLVGQANESSANTKTTIENSFATGSVTATSGNFVGGLIGLSYQLTLKNSFATGKVGGVRYVGGLIGDANTGTTITNNFATGKVTGSSELGALVGWSDGATYSASYYANNKGITNALGTNKSTPGDINPAGTTGAALADLQCPTTANDTTCAASLLYENWDTALWDFGSNAQLPGLIINGTVYRDGDGNGMLD